VPTTTGAAKSVAKIIKDLDNKFDGLSIRVPTPIVSIADIVAVLERPTTIEEINNEFEKISQGGLKNILAVTDAPVVSSDFIGNEMSAIIDSSLTNVVGGNMIKVVAWYDNEWGYSKRLVEIASLISHS
jgi:glyceraldehyde-3-phosphate dehydrogenase type I